MFINLKTVGYSTASIIMFYLKRRKNVEIWSTVLIPYQSLMSEGILVYNMYCLITLIRTVHTSYMQIRFKILTDQNTINISGTLDCRARFLHHIFVYISESESESESLFSFDLNKMFIVIYIIIIIIIYIHVTKSNCLIYIHGITNLNINLIIVKDVVGGSNHNVLMFLI